MESLLQIIIYNLSVIFTQTDRKRENAHVYLVFRELCKWSRDIVDLFLPTMKAIPLFTRKKIHRHGKRPSDVYYLLPNGKRNGLCKKFIYGTGYEQSFYLSGKVITRQTNHYYVNGHKRVDRQLRGANLVTYERGSLCIVMERIPNFNKTTITVMADNIKFRETTKGLDYSLRVFDNANDWCVKYKYTKSYIYNIKEVAEALVTLTQCDEGDFYLRALAFERTHKWRFQYGKPKKSIFGKRREDLRAEQDLQI